MDLNANKKKSTYHTSGIEDFDPLADPQTALSEPQAQTAELPTSFKRLQQRFTEPSQQSTSSPSIVENSQFTKEKFPSQGPASASATAGWVKFGDENDRERPFEGHPVSMSRNITPENLVASTDRITLPVRVAQQLFPSTDEGSASPGALTPERALGQQLRSRSPSNAGSEISQRSRTESAGVLAPPPQTSKLLSPRTPPVLPKPSSLSISSPVVEVGGSAGNNVEKTSTAAHPFTRARSVSALAQQFNNGMALAGTTGGKESESTLSASFHGGGIYQNDKSKSDTINGPSTPPVASSLLSRSASQTQQQHAKSQRDAIEIPHGSNPLSSSLIESGKLSPVGYSKKRQTSDGAQSGLRALTIPHDDPFATDDDDTEGFNTDAEDEEFPIRDVGYDSDELEEKEGNAESSPFSDSYDAGFYLLSTANSESTSPTKRQGYITPQQPVADSNRFVRSPSTPWASGRPPPLSDNLPRPARTQVPNGTADRPQLPPRPNPFATNFHAASPSTPSISDKPRLPPKPPRHASSNSLSPAPPLPSRPSPIAPEAVDTIPTRPETSYSSETDLGTDTQSQRNVQSGGSDVSYSALIPNAAGSNRSVPFLMYHEIQHKGSVRCFAVTGTHVCTSQQNTRVWSLSSGENVRTISHGDHRVSAVAFRPARRTADEGRYLWVGLNDGQLWVTDITTGEVVERRGTAHSHAITHILRSSRTGGMWTLDDNGIFQMWSPTTDGGDGSKYANSTGLPHVTLESKPKTHRLSPRITVAHVVAYNLWAAFHKIIEIYNPLDETRSILAAKIDVSSLAGNVSALATLPLDSSVVFSGHECGKIIVWDAHTRNKICVVNASLYRITAMVGVGSKYLWTGFQTGKVYVYDTKSKIESARKSDAVSSTAVQNNGAEGPPPTAPAFTNWAVVKDFKAHSSPVVNLILDTASMFLLGRMQIASCSAEGRVQVWDGLLEKDWLDEELQTREPDFATYNPTSVLLCSWNCDASKPNDLLSTSDDQNFLNDWLSNAGCATNASASRLPAAGSAGKKSPDIIVIGFQEMVDLENKRLTAKTLLKPKKNKAAKAAQKMEQQYRLWRDRLIQAVRDVHGSNCTYALIECRNLVGLFTCVFVKESFVNENRISEVAFNMVKTGLGGLHGNKGSIAIRFLIDDTSFCFINCHLAAGQSQTSSRNNDSATILQKATLPAAPAGACSFLPGGDGSQILDHECVVFSGDLNYRIDLPRARVITHVEKKEWTELLTHDQLRNQFDQNPFFVLGSRGFVEQNPCFAPTYKYDPGVFPSRYDTSEKKRCPAWCDRVLYRPLSRIRFPRLSSSPTTTSSSSSAPSATATAAESTRARGLEQTGFRCHECRVSDHKPISATYSGTLKKIDHSQRNVAIAQVEAAWKARREMMVVDCMVDWLMQAGGWSRPACDGREEERAWKALEERKWNVDDALRSLER